MAQGGAFRTQLLAGAATGILLAFSAPAYAQDAVDTAASATVSEGDDRRLETITVTGIRASIENSLAIKKKATSIVEAISAEDIGKLPDLSIADSLARLPGVTAQRVRGRSQSVSIRGLGPDFSLALLNGREIVSAGDNRGVEFDQFPSELIAQGIVYKTPDARLAAAGIAGSVDLRTVRPLSYDERRINLSAKYVLNDQDQLNPDFDEDGYRYFASYIDQNESKTFGWSIGVTHQSNPTQYTGRELKTNSGQTTVDATTGLVYPSDNPRTGAVSREFERTSVAGALQFQPNDRWETTIDAFYTETEDTGIFRGVETPIASWSGAQLTNLTGTSGFADSATFDNALVFTRTDTEGNSAEIFALGFNTIYNVTDKLSLELDLARSTLDRNDIDYESYGGTGFGGAGLAVRDTLTYNFDPDGEYSIASQLDYTDPNTLLLTDPGGWGQVGFIKEPKIEDELDQIRAEAEYELNRGFIFSVAGGVLFTQRNKTFDSNEAFLRAGNNWVDGSLSVPESSRVGVTDSGSIGFNILAYDPSSFLTDGTYNVEKATFDTEWEVDEEITTIYALANIDADLGTMPLSGNVGFQWVDTTQASTGTLAGGGEQTIEESYDNFLPSLNLSLEVAEDTFVRFAAAQTLTRPRMDQLAANQDIKLNTLVCSDTNGDQRPDIVTGALDPNIGSTCYTLSGGNPFLQPYQSTSFDLAFERYFSSASAVSLGLFHKEISDWVEPFNRLVDGSQQITAIGEGDFLAANPQIAPTALSGPVNLEDGSISGIEATVRLSFDDFLPDNLRGFGFNASYTYADASLENVDGETIDIPNYSDTVWSADIYYENFGWRTRLSARNRSEFRAELRAFDATVKEELAQEETIVDFQLGYEFEDGPLEGLAANFEVFNLTDEPFVTENITTNSAVSFPSIHEQYGTTYNLTVSKSF